MENGITFAAAREKAAKECGLKTDILNKPNNNLAVEYINAIKSINSKMQYKTVSRKGAAHDSKDIEAFVSASLLREKLISGDYEFCEKYMSDTNLGLLKSENIANIKNIENMILGILRTKSIYKLKKLPDISEGVENKLFSAIKTATSLEELYSLIKVKRYTLSRIRRLVVSAALGMDNSFFMQAPPYIRVLGFNKTGEEILKQSKEKSKIPLILRAKEIEELDESSKKLFDLECRSTDLYMLSLNKPRECGFEYKAKLIKG